MKLNVVGYYTLVAGELEGLASASAEARKGMLLVAFDDAGHVIADFVAGECVAGSSLRRGIGAAIGHDETSRRR